MHMQCNNQICPKLINACVCAHLYILLTGQDVTLLRTLETMHAYRGGRYFGIVTFGIYTTPNG